MNWIDYRDLPSADDSFSTLFLDYVTDYSRVEKFYSADFRRDDDWRDMLGKVCARPLNRSTIAQILTTQNRNYHCGVRTLSNIDLLLNDNTVAVVTGQQVGLFTGPLYTIYKTLTTLKLVDQLNERYPDYAFVPVFWLEGEDHDYEEVNSVRLINSANDLFKSEYPLSGKGGEKNFGAVGTISFDERIELLLSRVEESLVQTEFTPKVLELFRAAYQKGMTFNTAFTHLVNVLLEDSGLIFLDPHDRQVKRLLAPLFERELRQSPRFCQLVIDESAELEKNYHAQIKPKPINLFLFHSEGRHLLEPRPDGYSLKGTRKHLTTSEVLQFLTDSPELFSPNVVLRPLCQDSLLPTIAYVAGPSEVAYFAQLKGLYREVNLPQPIIYPRASITIVEDKVQKVLQRYSLPLLDFLRDLEITKEKVIAQLSDVNLDELFGGTRLSLQEALERMKPTLSGIDQTLLGPIETIDRKIAAQLDSLREKVLLAQKRRHETAMRQIDKAANHVFPYGNFQERELNVLHFLNKYGLEFLRWVHGEMGIDAFKHQVIMM